MGYDPVRVGYDPVMAPDMGWGVDESSPRTRWGRGGGGGGRVSCHEQTVLTRHVGMEADRDVTGVQPQS